MRWRSGSALEAARSSASSSSARTKRSHGSAPASQQHRRVRLDVGRADRAAQDVERPVADDRVEPGLERHLARRRRAGRGARGRTRPGRPPPRRGARRRAAGARRRAAGPRSGRGSREGAVVAGADQVDELLVGGGAVGGRVEQDRRHAPRVRPARPRSHPPRVAGLAPEVASASPWGTLTVTDERTLLAPQGPQRLARRAARAHRGRAPRPAVPRVPRRDREQRILDLDAARRPHQRGAAGPRTSQPAVGHGGLAPARGARVHRRASGRSPTTACRATARTSTASGSAAATACATATSSASGRPRSPTSARPPRTPQPTQIAGERLTLGDLPPTQRQVLVALARPYKHDEFAVPATNQDIAGELHL